MSLPLRVAILYNEPAPPDPDEDLRMYEANIALYDAVESMATACRENGWEPFSVVAGPDPRDVLAAAANTDVVVNFVEAIGPDARLEAAVAWLLEWTGTPFTGSGGLALSLALHKNLTNACLAAAGVRVPAGCLLEDAAADPLPLLRYPLIVKPSREDASLGIEAGSIVADETAARAQAARVIRRFDQPVVVEEFIEGRDLTSALVTRGGGSGPPQILPVREFAYSNPPPGRPNILTYDSKWDEQSVDFRTSPAAVPANLPDDARERIASAALAAWNALGLRDYARVDMRLPADGHPVVIDVNANPDLSSNAGLADTAAQAGISYPDLVRRIVEGALDRGRPSSRPVA